MSASTLQDEPVRAYPLFTGLTRPAMFMGVTLQFFVLAFFPALITFVATGAFIFSAASFGMFYGAGVIACKVDERCFEIILGRLKLRCPNRHYWGCHSYDAS